jgi:hypothetical protein
LRSTHAGVAELADAPGLGPGAERRPGSSPGTRTDRKAMDLGLQSRIGVPLTWPYASNGDTSWTLMFIRR